MTRIYFKRALQGVGSCVCFLGLVFIYKTSLFAEILSYSQRSNTPTLDVISITTHRRITTIKVATTTKSALTTTQSSSNLFSDMQDFVKEIPKKPGTDLVEHVSKLLSQPWHQNQHRSNLFRVSFENHTNLSTSQHMMLTQNNTPIGSIIQTMKENATIKVTKSIFNMLQKESLLKRYKTCSVVGSSGMFKGSQCGKAIDSSDFVFRFNLAPTIGFEEDVGNKTNMTTMNPSILKTLYGHLKSEENITNFSRLLSGQKGLIWTPGFTLKGSVKISMLAISTGKKANRDLTFIMEGTEHFKAFFRFWKQYDIKKLSSTGFYIVSCALALCDNVNIYGFWPFGKLPSGQDVKYHYFNDIKAQKHDMSLEFKWIFAMHHFGLLNLHVGNCTNG